MTKPKFTEGPWRIYRCGTNPGIEGKNNISVVVWGDSGELHGVRGNNIDEIYANARLIAKAPEMYGTLKAIADMHIDKETNHEELTALCMAMAMCVTDSIDNG